MAVRTYEGMFILDSNRFARDSGAVSGTVNELIEKHGGEVLVSRMWDERRLAYPINGQRKGAYWLTYFKLDSVRLKDLHRECQLNENVLRQLFLNLDPRVAEALVSIARGETIASEDGPEETEEGADAKAESAEPEAAEST